MFSIKLAVNEPCNQRYEAMQKGSQSRFCAHCETEVIDFSMFSNADLLTYFTNQQGRVCGRFTSFQLEKPIQGQPIKSNWRQKAAIFVTSSLTFFATQQVMAAEPNRNDLTTYQNSFALKDKREVNLPADTTHISGIVIASEDGLPIPGAIIRVKGTQLVVFADSAGRFNLLTHDLDTSNLILQITFIGYMSTEYKVEQDKHQKIKLTLDSHLMGEVVIVRRNNDGNIFLKGFNQLRRLFR
jgi:hypothetical protein